MPLLRRDFKVGCAFRRVSVDGCGKRRVRIRVSFGLIPDPETGLYYILFYDVDFGPSMMKFCEFMRWAQRRATPGDVRRAKKRLGLE